MTWKPFSQQFWGRLSKMNMFLITIRNLIFIRTPGAIFELNLAAGSYTGKHHDIYHL